METIREEDVVSGAIPRTRAQVWQRRLALMTLYVCFAAYGVSASTHPEPPALLFALAFSILMTWICIVDGRLRGTVLPWTTHWLIAMFWPVAVPAYYLWSRGWKGIPWLLLWVLSAWLAAFIPAFFIQVVLALRKVLG